MKAKTILKIAGALGVAALVGKVIHDHVEGCECEYGECDDDCGNCPLTAKDCAAKANETTVNDGNTKSTEDGNEPVNEAVKEESSDETIEKLFGTPGAEKTVKQEPMEFPEAELDVGTAADGEVETQERDPEAE